MSSYVKYFSQVSSNQMKCDECHQLIKYENAHKHSSALRNYFEKKHDTPQSPPKKVAKITHFFGQQQRSQSDLPNLPSLDGQAIAACCSSHPLPFDIVEDRFFQWAYNCSNTSKHKISGRVTEIAKEWRNQLTEALSNTFVILMVDGWKNSVNNNHHFCYMLWTGSDIIFWKSDILQSQSSDAIFESIALVLSELKQCKAKVSLILLK